MHAMRRIAAAVAVALGVVAGCFAAPALADFAVLTSTMKGANEVPPADPTATGTATVILDSHTGRVCYFVVTQGLPEPVTAGHIHQGAVGVVGPVVIPFATPTHGFTIGCTTAALTLVQSIIDNPGGFYTNVHDAQFPGGAIRGQLTALAVLRTTAGLLKGVPAGLPTGFPGLPAGFPGLPAGFPGLPAGFPGLPAGFPGLPTTTAVRHPALLRPARRRHHHHIRITVRTPQVTVHVG